MLLHSQRWKKPPLNLFPGSSTYAMLCDPSLPLHPLYLSLVVSQLCLMIFSTIATIDPRGSAHLQEIFNTRMYSKCFSPLSAPVKIHVFSPFCLSFSYPGSRIRMSDLKSPSIVPVLDSPCENVLIQYNMPFG